MQQAISYKKLAGTGAMLLVALAGSIFWLASQAASSAVALESEQGAVSAPAATGADSSASGGSYVTFNGSTSGGDPVVVAAGDIACASSDSSYNADTGTSTACRQKYTAAAASSVNPTAYLALGDEQYEVGSLSQFNLVYASDWGAFKAKTYPVIGNHEYSTAGASGYFSYFGDSATPRQPGCTSACQGYYSFDIGAWHLVALNSECSYVPGGCAAGSPQETWLKADLAAHPAKCTLAFWHEPYWASTATLRNSAVKPLVQDLYNAGAELILSGHSHQYERFAPQNLSNKADSTAGIRQFVVGTGGSFFTPLGTLVANSQVRQNTTFGVLRLTLHPTSYDWKFLPEAGKTFTDSGSAACH